MVDTKKSPLKGLFRSPTQATASARKGWMANSKATQALAHRLPVIRRRARKRITAVAACRRTFVKWYPQGFVPYIWLSSM